MNTARLTNKGSGRQKAALAALGVMSKTSKEVEDSIYIFHGESARYTSAVFSDLDKAEKWISENELTGKLTAYPLNKSAYDWAIENRHFEPKKEHHSSSKFIGGFTSAYQEHYHYENGKNS